MTDKYEPTIGDLWPNEESMPDDVKAILREMAEASAKALAEIDANPKHFTKSWWQVDKTTHGKVKRVWVNKPVGTAAGLWSFEPTIADSGESIIQIVRHKHVDELSASVVGMWDAPATLPREELVYGLAELVGLRTAKSVVKRLGLRTEGEAA